LSPTYACCPAVIEMQRDTYLMLTRDATVLNFAQWSLS
jgi:hypothetical protein